MYNKKDSKRIYELSRDDNLVYCDDYKELWPYSFWLHNLLNDIADNVLIEAYVNKTIQFLHRLEKVNKLHDLDPSLIGACTFAETPYKRLDRLSAVLLPPDMINESDSYGLDYFLSLLHDTLFEIASLSSNFSFRNEKFNSFYKYYKYIFDKTNLAKDKILFTILASIYVNDKDYKIADEYLTNPEYYNTYLASIDMLPRSVIRCGSEYIDYYLFDFKKLFDNPDVILNKHKKAIK